MAPPPAQKGKFRPKKPPKKIKAPTAPVPDGVASAPTVEFAPSTFAGRGEGRGGGRDGRGRGGRGRGRGRGRAPVPSGKTFFTAGEKQSAASSKKRRDKLGRKGDDPTEEIVDVLDVAIGPAKGKDGAKRSILDSMDRMDYEDQGQDDGGGGHFVVDGALYDSDSSREEERGRRRTDKTIQPLQLPFPMAPLPVGIGEKERMISYEVAEASRKVVDDCGIIAKETAIESSTSPFVDDQRNEDLVWEQNNWFLVQLPTRLPALKQNIADAAPGDEGEANEETSGNEIIVADSVAEVATAPIVANSFDDILLRTAPGRIGKIKVYKSGKTVLVMDSPDESKQVSVATLLPLVRARYVFFLLMVCIII
jgi:hypothetical protein